MELIGVAKQWTAAILLPLTIDPQLIHYENTVPWVVCSSMPFTYEQAPRRGMHKYTVQLTNPNLNS